MECGWGLESLQALGSKIGDSSSVQNREMEDGDVYMVDKKQNRGYYNGIN